MNVNDSLAFAASEKVTGWRLFLKTIVARAYPRVIGMQREKSWMFFDVFLPMLAVSAYVFVYRAIGAPEEYVGFVVVGGAMYSQTPANRMLILNGQVFREGDKVAGQLVLEQIKLKSAVLAYKGYRYNINY